MKILKRMGAFAALALFLSACSLLSPLGTGLQGTAAAIGDQFVPTAAQAPIANSAAAAENLYTGSVKSLTVAGRNGTLTMDQINRLDPLETKVFNAIVALRGVAQGKDVTAALGVFNAAYSNLYTAAKADGVTLTGAGQ